MQIRFTFRRRHHPLGTDQMSRFCGEKFYIYKSLCVRMEFMVGVISL